MADDTPRQPSRRRGRRALRVLRNMGLFFLSLLLALALLIGGLLLFARTDAGQRWVTGKVNEVLNGALAPSGLNAHIDALTGSLPSRLGFEGLTVSDADGPWLTVDAARLNMGWSALRKHSLVVRSITIDHPALTRLPHLTEGPENQPDQSADPLALLAKLADWPDWLPSLAVENLDVNSLALGPEVAGEAMTLSLHGSASASAQSLQAGLTLRRDDKPGAEQAEVRMALTPDAYLTLSLALAETPDGLAVRAVPTELAKAPALRFLLQGSAPLADWKGDVSVDLLETDTSGMSAATLNERIILALKGGVGVAPLEPDPRLDWDLTASTGKAATRLWRMAGQRNGQAVARMTGRAVLERPAASGGEDDGAATAKVQGHLGLNLNDMEWSDPRLSSLVGPDATLGADYAVDWKGASSAAPGREDAGLNAALHGLALKGREFSVQGDASWRLVGLDPLAPASALDVSLTADVSDASGLAIPDFSARGPLSLRLKAEGAMSNLNADLTLDGEALTARGEALERPHAHVSVADLDLSALAAELRGTPATGSGTEGRGVVEASVRVRGQDVNLNARWEATPAPDKLTAAVRDLSLTAAGLRVDGELGAVLPVAAASAASPAPSSSAASSAPSSFAAPLDPSSFASSGPAGGIALPSLSGTLRAEVSDWNVLSGLTGLPLSGGKASLSLNLAPGTDGQAADADLNVDSLRVGGTDGSERVFLTGVRGSIRVVDALRDPRLDVNVSGDRLHAGDVGLHAVRLTAQGALSGPLALGVHSEGDVTAEAQASWKPGEVAVQTLRLRLSERFVQTVQPAGQDVPQNSCPPPCPADTTRKAPQTAPPAGPWGARLLKPALIRYGVDGFSTPGLELALEPSGSIHVSGALNAQSLKLDGSVDKLDLSLFRPLFPALPEGMARAEVTLNGTPARPGGGLTVHLDGLRVPGSLMPPVSCTLEGVLTRAPQGGGTLDLALSFPPEALNALGAKQAGASLRLPLLFAANGLPRPAPRGALRGEAVWEGDLAPLWNFVPLADRRLTGRGGLRLDAAGSLERPELSGQIRVEQAAYQDLNLGLLFTDINASVDLDKAARPGAAGLMAALGQARLSLKAGDGMGGTLNLDGTLDPVTLAVDARGAMRDLKPLRRQDLRINLSGDATVTGKVSAPVVKAAITVNQGELLLTDLPGGSIAVLPISDEDESPAASAPADAPVGSLDVEVTVPNRFFVRGHGLDSDWQGQARAQGPLNAPSVVGDLRAVRGTLDLLNRNFDLSKGVITFDGGQNVNPRLDIVMTYTAANFQADVTVGGTASHPQLTLSSKPAMPQDEIIAQIMFGRPAGKLGRLETLQLAGAAAALAGFGNGGGGVFDLARKSLGVDVLRLGSSNDSDGGLGGSTLEVGKYVSDKVYVGVSQGLDADSTGAVVDVDLTRHISLEARTGSTRSEVGVEWSYDY